MQWGGAYRNKTCFSRGTWVGIAMTGHFSVGHVISRTFPSRISPSKYSRMQSTQYTCQQLADNCVQSTPVYSSRHISQWNDPRINSSALSTSLCSRSTWQTSSETQSGDSRARNSTKSCWRKFIQMNRISEPLLTSQSESRWSETQDNWEKITHYYLIINLLYSLILNT